MVGEELAYIYNRPFEMPLGILIPLYFYLTGLHAGCFMTSIVSTLIGRPEWKPIGRIGAILAVLILSLAPVFLIMDLANPLRFWHLMVPWWMNLKSVLSWGTVLLSTYPLVTVVYAWCLFTERYSWAKRIGILGFPMAIGVHGYTGFVVALAKRVPIWNTALMPSLFLISAILSGMALIRLLAVFRLKYLAKDISPKQRNAENGVISLLGYGLIVLILVDLFMVFSNMTVLLTSTEDAYTAAMLLLEGPLSTSFLITEVLLGLIIPVLLLAHPRTINNPLAMGIASVLIVIGIFEMRVVVIFAGELIPLV